MPAMYLQKNVAKLKQKEKDFGHFKKCGQLVFYLIPQFAQTQTKRRNGYFKYYLIPQFDQTNKMTSDFKNDILICIWFHY